MSSEKLRKYLKYYQKVLTSDPENIEARLRLAAIFRELGKISHAVDEYVTASKLLAKEGLPLEAIAACKAVLELDPTQTEIQYFLARLFAQIPSAGGITSRIAQPKSTSIDPIIVPPLKKLEESIFEVQEAQNSALAQELGIVLTPDVEKKREERTEKIGYSGPKIDDIEEEETNNEDDFLREEEELGLIYQTDVFDENQDDDELDNTSPLETGKVDEVLDNIITKTKIPPIPKAPNTYVPVAERATRIAQYDSIKTLGEIESFEVGVFDFEEFDIDLPSEEIDLEFLEGLEISLSETSALDEPVLERVEVERGNLPRIPLFSSLSQEAFIALLNKIELHRFAAGEILLSPTHDKTCLSILIKGRADVTRIVEGKTIVLDVLNVGEFFGEFRLLTDRVGSAMITSTTDVEVLSISAEMIDAIAQKEPSIWDVLWEFYHERMLNNLLATGPIFKSLDSNSRLKLARDFSMTELIADELLLAAGEGCDYLFLVLSGEVVVERNRHGLTEELAALREGEFFGVASSLDKIPYIADVRAVKDTTLLCLPADKFREVVKDFPEIEEDINRFVSSRRKLNDVFTSGMTSYGELGVYRFHHENETKVDLSDSKRD